MRRSTRRLIRPSTAGRFRGFLDITRYETWDRSRYDGLQMAFNEPAAAIRGSISTCSYTLSWAKGHTNANRFGAVNNPFNPEDEYLYLTTDQRHRVSINGARVSAMADDPVGDLLRWIAEAVEYHDQPGSVPHRHRPVAGHTEALCSPKNGERMLKSDYKLDLRLTKAFRFRQAQLQGMIDVFNVLNTVNWGSYGTTFGTSTYLVAGSSTNLFYQPRQFQFGVRMTF